MDNQWTIAAGHESAQLAAASSSSEGTVDAKVLGGIYFGLVGLATLQLVRVVLSKTRRFWSLQSAYLALCLSWCLCRAIYFTVVFDKSESCRGFKCFGGKNDGGVCNYTALIKVQCPGGECSSNSEISCEGQHLLFGLPTMIQTFMLSTLIYFYALWVHKANGHIFRRRVFFLVATVTGIYYSSFFFWVLVVRCGSSSRDWMQCEWCKPAMDAVTGFTLFVLSATLSYFSWKLYIHAQRPPPPSTVQAPSGRRKIISINMLIVSLFVSHGIFSLLDLSPDREDVLPCPILLFPTAIICIVAEVFPALLLLLHFRRISRPSLSTSAKEDPTSSIRAEPSRPEEVYNDLSSSSSDSEEENQLSESETGGTFGELSLFGDLNRYDNTHGIFQSSPNFREPLL